MIETPEISVKYTLTIEDEKEIEKLMAPIVYLTDVLQPHPATIATLYEDVYARYVIGKVITNKDQILPTEIDTGLAIIKVAPATLSRDVTEAPVWIWSIKFKDKGK